MESIKTAGAVLGSGLNAFISDWDKVLAAAAGVSLLALGVYTAKGGTGVVARYVESRIGKPSLVRETSRMNFVDVVRHPIKTVKSLKVTWILRTYGLNLKKIFITQAKSVDALSGVVLEPKLEERLRDIALATKNTKHNKYGRHLFTWRELLRWFFFPGVCSGISWCTVRRALVRRCSPKNLLNTAVSTTPSWREVMLLRWAETA